MQYMFKHSYGSQFLLTFRVALPVLADNIRWFLNHGFQYRTGCPVVGIVSSIYWGLQTPLFFVAIAPACFNGLIWNLLCKILLDSSKLHIIRYFERGVIIANEASNIKRCLIIEALLYIQKLRLCIWFDLYIYDYCTIIFILCRLLSWHATV